MAEALPSTLEDDSELLPLLVGPENRNRLPGRSLSTDAEGAAAVRTVFGDAADLQMSVIRFIVPNRGLTRMCSLQ